MLLFPPINFKLWNNSQKYKIFKLALQKSEIEIILYKNDQFLMKLKTYLVLCLVIYLKNLIHMDHFNKITYFGIIYIDLYVCV